MLIEVKVKVARVIDGKTRKRTETYIVDDCQLFVEAEHQVTAALVEEQNGGVVEEFEIQSLRISPIREVCTLERTPSWTMVKSVPEGVYLISSAL